MIMSNSRLPLLFFYAILLVPLVSHSLVLQRDPYVLHNCSTSGNVSSNGTFRANLNTLISAFSSNTQIDYGFYNFSAGEGTDKVYATGLCRADLTSTDCRICLNNSGHELLQLCPNEKEGIMWYMNCTVRYSNNSIFGVMETTPIKALVSGSVPNVTEFDEVLDTLFYKLRLEASAGGIFRKVAVGNAPYQHNTDTIYGLMQCSPDLSEMACSNCLVTALDYFQSYCRGRDGARVLAPSCNLRIQPDQFYDSILVESPPSLSPPPVPAKSLSPSPVPAKGNKSNSSKNTIIIIVSVVVFVVLIICICLCLRVKKQRKKVENVLTCYACEAADEISNTESLQFNFPTIRVATDNFSDANKVGTGGFGAVYKAWKNWRNMTTSNIIDPTLGVGSKPEIIRCIHIGLLCVQENVADRPTMSSIILMLNGNSITLSVPSQPAFLTHNNVEPDISSNQSILASINEASITALYPR
ncbi:cysteine-rich receptor-like protein kinase 29 [Quercus suber]|uniref:Cysteine-rich receptor-like protein kinase 29 n=1 Tax=Quercus suber TaxID=58331 RepID=A0AAW0JZF9_QUESU